MTIEIRQLSIRSSASDDSLSHQDQENQNHASSLHAEIDPLQQMREQLLAECRHWLHQWLERRTER